MMFSMARDNRLPFGSHIARVSGRGKVPIIPALVTGILTLALLSFNLANQSAFVTLTSVAIIMFYLGHLGVTGPMLIAQIRGTWPRPEHGPCFSLGRWGMLVNVLAVADGVFVAFNIAWPRVAVHGNAYWYYQYGAYVFIGGVAIIGGLYYFLVQVKKSGGDIIAEHRADGSQFELAEPVISNLAP